MMTMTISKSLKDFEDEARKGDSYWVEAAKLQFSMELDRRRQSTAMTNKAVADKLGTSQAYITKVFRGDSNLTIESMVRLARATGGRLEISIVDADAGAASKWNIARIAHAMSVRPRFTVPASTAIAGHVAANHHQFREPVAA